MQSTRRELVDDILRHVGELGDSGARTLAEDAINRAILSIWLAHTWRDHILPMDVQVTTVANQRAYALPPYFGRIPPRGVVRNVTSPRTLAPVQKADLDAQYPVAGTTAEVAGEPVLYYLSGNVGVTTQPASTGDALEVVSDSASDVAVRAVVEGINGSGQWARQSVTVTGLAAAAIGTWKYVINFSKAYPAATTPTTPYTSSEGSVTLRKVTGAVVLETLQADESAHEYPSLTLYPMPSRAGDVIAIPTLRAPKRLTHDGDEVPRFWGPAVFEDMIANWRSNTGEVGDAAQVARPMLRRLIEWDNSGARTAMPTSRPFQP
jgi:hypothetical protein